MKILAKMKLYHHELIRLNATGKVPNFYGRFTFLSLCVRRKLYELACYKLKTMYNNPFKENNPLSKKVTKIR